MLFIPPAAYVIFLFVIAFEIHRVGEVPQRRSSTREMATSRNVEATTALK
jgi:hypothetical protein